MCQNTAIVKIWMVSSRHDSVKQQIMKHMEACDAIHSGVKTKEVRLVAEKIGMNIEDL